MSELGSLVETSIIHPIIDKVFLFTQMNNVNSYVETVRVKEKVIVKVK